MVVTFNDPEGPVAVRCIAKRNSPYSVDTFTKTIYILPRNTVNYLGTFEGQSTQFPGETYRIKIDTLDKHGKSMVHTAFMTNLIRGCNYDEHVVLGAPNVFTVFIQYRPPGCAMAQVYDDLSPAYTIGFYDPQNGQINIKYNSVKTNNPSGFTYTVDREHVFTGIRVTP